MDIGPPFESEPKDKYNSLRMIVSIRSKPNRVDVAPLYLYVPKIRDSILVSCLLFRRIVFLDLRSGRPRMDYFPWTYVMQDYLRNTVFSSRYMEPRVSQIIP